MGSSPFMRTKLKFFIMGVETGRNAFYVAIFATCSLVILIIGGGYLCGYDMLNMTSCYNFVLEDCQNLSVGNAVFLKGYKVGSITNVIFNKKESNFKIIFCVDKDIKVTEDSSVAVCTSLLGNKSINLFLGSGKVVSPGASLRVEKKVDDIEAKISSLVSTVQNVSESLNSVLKNVHEERIVGKVGVLLSSFQKTVFNLNTLIEDIRTNPKKYIKLF